MVATLICLSFRPEPRATRQLKTEFPCSLSMRAQAEYRGALVRDADGDGEGEITSGGFSPTIGRSIALARVPAGDHKNAQVEVRGKLLNVRIVPTPFVRNGKIQIEGELQQ